MMKQNTSTTSRTTAWNTPRDEDRQDTARSMGLNKERKPHQPIFNNEYAVIDHLGEGKTSKVYLCQSLQNPNKKVALKLIRDEFIKQGPSSISSIE